jgi:hypothetical protein
MPPRSTRRRPSRREAISWRSGIALLKCVFFTHRLQCRLCHRIVVSLPLRQHNWCRRMWPFRKKQYVDMPNVYRVPIEKLRYTQLDITERFNDDSGMRIDEWISTTPLSSLVDDPNINGLPSPGASADLVYEIALEMSLQREAAPQSTMNDGVYCPVCHIANVDRSRLHTPCPQCGRGLLSFGWD